MTYRSDTQINATFTISADADAGIRDVSVVSNGTVGSGFLPGPGMTNVSNTVGFNVSNAAPRVEIQSVGFKGDHDVKRFVNGDINDPIIAPGNEPTWKSKRATGEPSNNKFPVCYTIGQTPTIFASVSVERADNSLASIRVKRGETLLATIPNIRLSSNGSLSLGDIGLPAQLGETPKAKESNYKFKWEISINGSSWKSIGESGDHKIYWTIGDPYDTPFHGVAQFGNVPYSGLYDLALEKSIGKLDDGTSDTLEVIRKITEETASELTYAPSRGSLRVHPLEVYSRIPKTYQCSDNAVLLRGLLRTAGTDGTVNYYWGGNPGTQRSHWYIAPGSVANPPTASLPNGENRTAQFDRPQLGTSNVTEYVPKNPYFTFHATVTAGTGSSYDPSYGTVDQGVKLIQAVDARGMCLRDSAANAAKVISTNQVGLNNPIPFDRACDDPVQPPNAPRRAAFVTQFVPTSMSAGQSYNASVTMRNIGSETWTAVRDYKLGSQNPQDTTLWRDGRVYLPDGVSVPPNSEYTFNFPIRAPSTSGTHNFQWRMLQESVEWFGDYSPNVSVDVAPSINLTYDAVADYSRSSNPAGTWSYGQQPATGGAVSLFTAADEPIFGLERWMGQASVMRNRTGTTLSYSTIQHPPDMLNLHPSQNGERAVVRWTAPSAGTYTITGRFQGLDVNGTTTDVRVTHGGASLFVGDVNGFNA